MTREAAQTLHATCLIVGEAGVLIRGASGAGKSRLARALLAEAALRGLFARLVGDDHVSVEAAGGRLIAHGHPAVAGLIEARGLGLLPARSEAFCVVRLVVDLEEQPGARMQEPSEQAIAIAGIAVPRLALGREADRADLVLAALTLGEPVQRGDAPSKKRA
ncbi:MAG: aldolase [Rhizobiales bacterium]|nr:aldolase [Hyphomicrobiales bacterium]